MKGIIAVVFGIFVLTTGAYAQIAPMPAPHPAVSAMHRNRDRFPEMHKALRKLRMAREDLQKAAHDYDGHRMKAIAAINEAMEQIRLGLESVREERKK